MYTSVTVIFKKAPYMSIRSVLYKYIYRFRFGRIGDESLKNGSSNGLYILKPILI